MAEPQTPTRSRVRCFQVILAIAALSVVPLGIAIGGIFYTRYRASIGESTEQKPALVSIGNPRNGAQENAGEALMVDATAIGPREFLSMELWVDGALASVQAAPPGGVTPFRVFFTWLPQAPGLHSLVAIALDADEDKSVSPQTLVLVSAEGEQVVDTSLAAVQPQVEEGVIPPPSGPTGDDSVGPAEPLSGSVGDWITSLAGGQKPQAPELIAAADGCGAVLTIHDLSEDEEGFAVYRQMAGEADWIQVALIEGQSEADWLTYEDPGVPGGVLYYVTAFNQGGTSMSNLTLVNVDPDACPSQAAESPGWGIGIPRLLPDLDAERAYCYKTIDGVHWSRWPQAGFFGRLEEGGLAGGPVVQMLVDGFDGQASLRSLDLSLECWGWVGPALQYLGDFTIEDLGPEFVGSTLAAGEGLSAEVLAEEVFEAEPLPVGAFGSSLTAEGPIFPESSLHPQIIRPRLSVTLDRDVCGQNLPPGAQGQVGLDEYCTIYQDYYPAPGGPQRQPYLYWDPDARSPATNELDCFGDPEDCLPYNELLDLADSTGGQVGFELTVISEFGMQTWRVTVPYLTAFPVPPLFCEGGMTYHVRTWYTPGLKGAVHTEGQLPSRKTMYSQASNSISIACTNRLQEGEPLALGFQQVEVTFTDLVIGSADDDGAHESLEVYGYLKVIAPSMGQEAPCYGPDLLCPDGTLWVYDDRFFNLAAWEEQADGCPDDIYTVDAQTDFTVDGRLVGCPQRLFDGPYDLRELYMCQSTSKRHCFLGDFNRSTKFDYNSNAIRLSVKDGDALGFEIALYDWDDASANDLVCQTFLQLPGKTLEEWADTQNEKHTISTGETDSGQCTLSFVINAVE